MQEHALPYLREVLLFLTLAGILIPLLQKCRINDVLGFLAVGAVIGPYGLGDLARAHAWLAYLTFPRITGVSALGELGVLFLMFTIGLELSAERLWALRRWVFGAGPAQVVLSAVAIGSLAFAFGNSPQGALLLGLALASSSTAIVMQLLVRQRELGSPLGQAAFSLLLFQDVALVPVLILLGVLGAGTDQNVWALLGLALLKAAAVFAVIFLLGRQLVRPLFRHFARAGRPDTFMALTLLSTLGIAALTAFSGLSLALGAFLAGLLLAETEYRHEVEVTIEPFKGLLLGLFFMTVGMKVDVRAVLAEPLWLPLAVLGLFAIKAAIAAVVLRAFGLSSGPALEGGLLLGQGGEFAFIVMGSAMTLGLIDARIGQFMMLTAGLSLFATPLAARLGRALGSIWETRFADPRRNIASAELPPLAGHVVIAGFGRVGQLLVSLLESRGVRYIALESDARIVARYHPAGMPVFFGDASRTELLRRVHVESAAAVVLTMDDAASALHAVRAVRREYPHVPLLARARDEKHALALKSAGATAVVLETLEAGLQLAAFALGTLGFPQEVLDQMIGQEREARIVALRGK